MQQAFDIYAECRSKESARAPKHRTATATAATSTQVTCARHGDRQQQQQPPTPSVHVKTTLLKYRGPLSSASFTDGSDASTRRDELTSVHKSAAAAAANRPKTAVFSTKNASTSKRQQQSSSHWLPRRKTVVHTKGRSTHETDQAPGGGGGNNAPVFSPRTISSLSCYREDTDIDNGIINAVSFANGLDRLG